MYQPQQNKNASTISTNKRRSTHRGRDCGRSTPQKSSQYSEYTAKSNHNIKQTQPNTNATTYTIPRSVRKTNPWKKQDISTNNKQKISLTTAQNAKEISEEKKQMRTNNTKHTLAIKYNAMRTEDIAWQTRQPASHVFHVVSWAKYMNKQSYNSKMEMKILEKSKDAFTLNNILSVDECKKLIYLSESHGYVPLLSALKGRTYRTNTRVIFDDKSLAKLLYERMKMFLPKTYKLNGKIWRMCGLNSRFRFCKYISGQHFNIHNDKRVELRNENKASFYTVNIYLNNGYMDYDGGRTIFYGSNSKWRESSHVIGIPGLALVFNHFPQKYKHAGEKIVTGTKYIARTDVMYQCS